MLAASFRFIFTAFALSCSLLILSSNTQAQDKATEACEKALQKSAKQSGKEYSNTACASNVYDADFWECVSKELDTFELNIAINFCEKSYGFK